MHIASQLQAKTRASYACKFDIQTQLASQLTYLSVRQDHFQKTFMAIQLIIMQLKLFATYINTLFQAYYMCNYLFPIGANPFQLEPPFVHPVTLYLFSYQGHLDSSYSQSARLQLAMHLWTLKTIAIYTKKKSKSIKYSKI